jgi:vacuolar-type H+-ATPase subunit H
LQRDRVLAQANEEAARILQQARAKGEEMLDQDVSVQAAQNRAANVVEEARQQAAQIRAEADTYVLHVLSKLEQTLTRNLNTVRNGINEVQQPDMAPVIDESAQGDAHFPSVNMNVDVEETRDTDQPNISLRRKDGAE